MQRRRAFFVRPTNQLGLSLIEAVVSIGLLAMAATIFSAVYFDSLKSQHNVSTLTEATEFIANVGLSLSDGNTCTANLLAPGNISVNSFNPSAVPGSVTINSLKTIDNKNIIFLNFEPTLSLKVTKLELTHFKALVAASQYLADLHIELTKRGDNAGASASIFNIPVRIGVVLKDGAAHFKNCATNLVFSTDDFELFCDFLNDTRNNKGTTTSPATNPWLNVNNSFFCGVVAPGTIQYFARATPPAGWLVADGSLQNKKTYERLFAAIGNTYGGDSSTFRLPDLTKKFVRSWNNSNTGIDKNRPFGTDVQLAAYNYRVDSFAVEHSHSMTAANHGHVLTDPGHSHTAPMQASGYGVGTSGNPIYQASGSRSLGDSFYTGTAIGGATNPSAAVDHRFSYYPSYRTLYTSGNSSISSNDGARPDNMALLPCIKF